MELGMRKINPIDQNSVDCENGNKKVQGCYNWLREGRFEI